MPNIIDRRKNPSGKSIGNRQRFLRRASDAIRKAVKDAVAKRDIKQIDSGGEPIYIPSRGIREPILDHSSTGGNRNRILPGNKEFVEGDTIPRPSGGESGGGTQASPDGDGEDAFAFTLTKEEFLEFFFEDLELPDLIKTELKEDPTYSYHRSGFARVGSPANLNLERSFKNSLGRRLALHRPSDNEIQELEEKLLQLENDEPRDENAIYDIVTKINELKRKQSGIPFFDPLDLRYNRFEVTPTPATKAVMFCLMDVSGSMGEREKDIAKRFFMLLYLFLTRRYQHIDIVFVRHTHEAEEVDEKEFFYSTVTGGTQVSTCLEVMSEIVKKRYSTGGWNIYAAQASDGENLDSDNEVCYSLLDEKIMPIVQYYAYIEIVANQELDMFASIGGTKGLWQWYSKIAAKWPNFQMKKLADQKSIWPVFRELFERKRK